MKTFKHRCFIIEVIEESKDEFVFSIYRDDRSVITNSEDSYTTELEALEEAQNFIDDFLDE